MLSVFIIQHVVSSELAISPDTALQGSPRQQARKNSGNKSSPADCIVRGGARRRAAALGRSAAGRTARGAGTRGAGASEGDGLSAVGSSRVVV